MPTIKIDDDVFAFLQSHARPFVDSPNSTLRRLLKIDSPPKDADNELDALLSEAVASARTKAPKTDLKELIRAGLVREGEPLFLVDYQGKRVPGKQATVHGSLLAYNGQFFSMSSLAEDLLKEIGFRSNSVRGPAHWANAAGTPMQTLWAQLLTARSNA
jgi:hypothetical protein